MSINARFFSIDIILLNSLTIFCWISTSIILYWTSKISRSIELYRLGFMLMNDRIKYLLYRRMKRNMQINTQQQQTIQRNLLFFSRLDFSNEVNGYNDILRSQSTC